MADDYSEEIQSLRGLSTPARNHYFYGKLLDVQHFTLEQQYFNRKRWLLNRLGLGSGVMCGLKLTVAEGQLVLLPGVALDPLGREIIVPAAVPLDPRQITDDCGKPIKKVEGGEVTICLAYHPCATEMVPVLVTDCDTREGCAPSTIRESFAVLVHEGPPPSYEPACPIPDLFKPEEGQPRTAVREVYARLLGLLSEACAEVGDETCVVLGQVTIPAGNAPLSESDVRPTGRRVVLNNALLFQLLLCLWERVEQCCAATAPSPTPSPTPTPPPTPSPTPSPTPTPPPTPSPTPSPTPTPTPPPVEALLKVGAVRVLNTGDNPTGRGREVGRLVNPSRPLEVRIQEGPNTIEVEFTNAAVDFASVEADKTFAVAVFVGGRRRLLAGRVFALPGNIVRWTSLELQVLPAGEYEVVLVGNPPTPDAPVIVSQRGRRLDGEPHVRPPFFPSGDDREGGNFVFGLRIT